MNPFRSLFLSLSRMPPMLMLVAILGLAVVVTMLVMNEMGKGERRAADLIEQLDKERNQKTTIVKTAKDISQGSLIAAEDLEESQIQSSKAPESAIGSISSAMGNYAAVDLAQGTVLLNGHIKHTTLQSTGFEGKIKDGMRALTFAVDTNTGVAGFIAPGSHVDVLCTVGSGADTKVAPVMSDVEVIAVGQIYQKQTGSAGATPSSSVTVSVTPSDSAKLVKSIKAGQLYLSLRNDHDHTPVAVVDVTSLFPRQAKPLEVVADMTVPPPTMSFSAPGPVPGPGPRLDAQNTPPPAHEIELWSGGKKELLTVPQG